MAAIDRFREKYAFLSNFHPSEVGMDGLLYPTVEHAYQAAKTLNPGLRAAIRTAGTPGYAKQMGRAMYNMLLNGPLDKSQAILTVQETRDACSYCRSLVEKDIRTLVFSCIPDAPDDAEDVVHEPTVGEVTL